MGNEYGTNDSGAYLHFVSNPFSNNKIINSFKAYSKAINTKLFLFGKTKRIISRLEKRSSYYLDILLFKRFTNESIKPQKNESWKMMSIMK